jgi:hypothetical protein
VRLVFIEGGRQIGDVRLENGELVGALPSVQIVESAMRRYRVDAEEALRRLDGWSNGYLTTKLHRD